MLSPRSLGALLGCAVSAAVYAQAPAPTPRADASLIKLQYGTFDPLVAEPEVTPILRSLNASGLWIVQLRGVPTQLGRDAITAAGGEILGNLPERAFIARMSVAAAEAVRTSSAVRWVGSYHPAYRLEPALLDAQAWLQAEPVRYHLVVANKHTDKPALMAKVKAIGGRVDDEQKGSLLLDVTLTGPQLLAVAGFDEVVWVDRWTPTGEDMDNARIQGGANYIETQGGFTGAGLNVHIYEGIEATHQDFTGGATNVDSGGGSDTHGHCTAGCVFGNGTSNPAVRGMAPDCNKFFTQYSSVTASRWQVVSDLVNIHQIVHTTASWGDAQTTAYTSVSADADDICFDHGIAWTNSQSNTGTQASRPQAWAKNVFSIGAVEHFNDSNPANDSWAAGGASIGPAADGRMKPELCAYYDAIGTSDLTGAAGYSSANWYASFGGTSGATPIVAGHNVLAIQMFTQEVTSGVGLLGNPMRVPGGTRFQNRPHFPTLKALEIVSATQYTFNAGSTDNRREHQGFGFPSLRRMYDYRAKTYIVDETSVLTEGSYDRHNITVAAGEPDLKICLNWAEPAAVPSAAQTLINNLSLIVTAPNGTIYYGNNGITNGMWSTAGGSEDTINSLECVFVQNPQAGVWTVDVLATSIAQDNHVETPQVDADYGLVVSGGTGQQGTGGIAASASPVGSGCGGSPGCAEGIYEFPSFSLANTSFSLLFSGGNYQLTPGVGTWIAPAGTTLALGDDTQAAQALAFSLPYPGGTTNSLLLCSNGWFTTGAYTGGANYTPVVATFLTNAMWCALWRDLNPALGGSVTFDSTASRAVFTWNAVPNYGAATSPNTFQVQFWANGDVHFLYQTISVSGNYLVGFSKANASDPGSTVIATSLGAGLGVCGTPVPPVPNVTLSSAGLPHIGSTVSLVTTHAPAGTLLGLSILSTTPLTPGLDLAFLGMPTCTLYESLDVMDTIAIAGGTGSRPFSVPNNVALIGVVVMSQTATLTPGANPFGFLTSNGLRLQIGS